MLGTNPVYTTITTRNCIGHLILNEKMAHHENVALFLATEIALGDKAPTYVDVEDHHTADGMELWARLESKFMGDNTPYDNQKLLTTYHSMHRQPNQTKIP